MSRFITSSLLVSSLLLTEAFSQGVAGNISRQDEEANQAESQMPIDSCSLCDDGGADNEAEPKTDNESLTKLPSPAITLSVAPITGEGRDRTAKYTLTNQSDKTIIRFEAEFRFLRDDGSVANLIPRTHIIRSKSGETAEFEIERFFIKEDTGSVAVLIREIIYADQSTWPPVPDKPPARKGDDPVAAKAIGVVGEGAMRMPATALHNYGDKSIKTITCKVEYFDEQGKEIGSANQIYYRGERGTLPPGKTVAVSGGKGPPDGTVVAKAAVIFVTFYDDTEWRRPK